MYDRITSNLDKWILLYPNAHVLVRWPYNLNNDIVKDGKLVSERGSRQYFDTIVSPSYFLYDKRSVVMTMTDFLVYINHDIEGTYLGPSETYFCNRNSPRWNQWFIVLSENLFLFIRYQTWWNSQTQIAKLISVPIRRIFAADTDSLHKMRRLALVSLYTDFSIIVDERVNGVRYLNKKKGCFLQKISSGDYLVAVSGHLVNLLLYSGVNLICFKRYLDTIEENVRLFSEQSKIPSGLKILLGKEILAEDNELGNIRRLWHSYIEFRSAVGCYILLCGALRLKVNIRAVHYCLKRLNMILKRYPRFITAEGWQARKFHSTIQGSTIG
jgi:hypothetical protein